MFLYNCPLVSANVNDVEVLVDLPFILMLKEFAMTSIKPLTTPTETGNEPDAPMDVEDAGVSPSPPPESPKKTEPASSADVIESPAREGTSDQGKLTISAKIKRPIVALVEDARDKESRALVLNVCIDYAAKCILSVMDDAVFCVYLYRSLMLLFQCVVEMVISICTHPLMVYRCVLPLSPTSETPL